METREYQCRVSFCKSFAHAISLPYHAFQDVVDNEMTLNDDKQERHMCPAELAELELILTLLQVSNEEHKAFMGGLITFPLPPLRCPYKSELTYDVEDETDESVMGSKWKQECIYHDYLLEVVHNRLSVKKVICRYEKVPGGRS